MIDFPCYKCRVRTTVLYRKDKKVYCEECYEQIKRKEGQEKELNENGYISRVEIRES
jgi:uncharacterized Zn finger protein (UPF0148 family)